MKITKPEYFDRFRCIAASCPDSCCKEWDVDVDEAAANYYRSLPGDLGDRLREVLREEDGQTVMTIVDGRCPMWRSDSLCRIQAELGEQALCHVCREFPRLRHDYGDFIELGLELSCPEAARIILSGEGSATVTTETEEVGICEYDQEAMACLLASRQAALNLLDILPPAEALAALLVYGAQAQQELDGEEEMEFSPADALETGRMLAKNGDITRLAQFFLGLEILTDKWKNLLSRPKMPAFSPKILPLARYLIQRYWLQAISDYDLQCRVKFIVICCILVASLEGDFLDAAQLFSKEIENDADNVDAILDGAYCSPTFADDKLLGLLLGGNR